MTKRTRTARSKKDLVICIIDFSLNFYDYCFSREQNALAIENVVVISLYANFAVA